MLRIGLLADEHQRQQRQVHHVDEERPYGERTRDIERERNQHLHQEEHTPGKGDMPRVLHHLRQQLAVHPARDLRDQRFAPVQQSAPEEPQQEQVERGMREPVHGQQTDTPVVAAHEQVAEANE